MKVVDVPRPKRRPVAVLAGDDDAASRLTAFCPTCSLYTPMHRPKRRVSNGIAITTGKCVVCKRETYRVGAARSGDEGDFS